MVGPRFKLNLFSSDVLRYYFIFQYFTARDGRERCFVKVNFNLGHLKEKKGLAEFKSYLKDN